MHVNDAALPSIPNAKRLPNGDLIMDMTELTSQSGCCTLCRYTKTEELFFKDLTVENIAEMDKRCDVRWKVLLHYSKVRS